MRISQESQRITEIEINHYSGSSFTIKLDISVLGQVFIPSPFSLLLSNNLHIRKGDRVLDIGCGSGILSIAAAKLGAQAVYSIDVNPFAIYATKRNSRLNNVEKFIFPIYEDMRRFFKMSEDKFDIIISNPPQLPQLEIPSTWYDKSLYAPRNGRYYIDLIISESRKLLKKKGRLQLVTTSIINYELTKEVMIKHGFHIKELDYLEIPFRDKYILSKSLIDALSKKYGIPLYKIKNGLPYETIYVVLGELK